ncbi:MAG TPA: hypothetical protein VII35_06545 [Steroidobacteraceae bacterium]
MTSFYDFSVQALDGSRLVNRCPSATKPTDPTFLQDLADVL